MQGRMGNLDGEGRQRLKYRCRYRRVMPNPRLERRRPSHRSSSYHRDTSQVCLAVLLFIYFSTVLFETSDLHEIENTLRECKKIRGIRMVLLRTDMFRKTKRYDSKLSHILQTVQVSSESTTQSRRFHNDPISLITQQMKLALDSRFASVGQNRKV
jgi:hypothetical protein